MSERSIEYMDIEVLQPDPSNPKTHAQAAITASIERFGYTTPIELDERTGLLAGGHGRLESLLTAKADGKPPPDGIVLTAEGRWLAPVLRGHVSRNDDEALAYLIASNSVSEAGGWEYQALAESLKLISAADFTLIDTTGFTAKEAADLIDLMALPITPSELSREIGPHDPATFSPRITIVMTRDEHARYLKACGDAPDDNERFRRMLVAMEQARVILDATPWES